LQAKSTKLNNPTKTRILVLGAGRIGRVDFDFFSNPDHPIRSLMDHCFPVVGDKIAALTCRLAGEEPGS